MKTFEKINDSLFDSLNQEQMKAIVGGITTINMTKNRIGSGTHQDGYSEDANL